MVKFNSILGALFYAQFLSSALALSISEGNQLDIHESSSILSAGTTLSTLFKRSLNKQHCSSGYKKKNSNNYNKKGGSNKENNDDDDNKSDSNDRDEIDNMKGYNNNNRNNNTSGDYKNKKNGNHDDENNGDYNNSKKNDNNNNVDNNKENDNDNNSGDYMKNNDIDQGGYNNNDNNNQGDYNNNKQNKNGDYNNINQGNDKDNNSYGYSGNHNNTPTVTTTETVTMLTSTASAKSTSSATTKAVTTTTIAGTISATTAVVATTTRAVTASATIARTTSLTASTVKPTSPPVNIPIKDRCSLNGANPSKLKIKNNMNIAIDIIWKGYTCREMKFTTIAPGGVWNVHTFYTHPWVAKTSIGGNFVAEFMANKPVEKWEISGTGVCSINSNIATNVTIQNRMNYDIDILWKNYKCGETLYGTLKAGQSYVQQTFFTHPWVAKKKDGTIVSQFMPTMQGRNWAINSSTN